MMFHFIIIISLSLSIYYTNLLILSLRPARSVQTKWILQTANSSDALFFFYCLPYVFSNIFFCSSAKIILHLKYFHGISNKKTKHKKKAMNKYGDIVRFMLKMTDLSTPKSK